MSRKAWALVLVSLGCITKDCKLNGSDNKRCLHFQGLGFRPPGLSALSAGLTAALAVHRESGAPGSYTCDLILRLHLQILSYWELNGLPLGGEAQTLSVTDRSAKRLPDFAQPQETAAQFAVCSKFSLPLKPLWCWDTWAGPEDEEASSPRRG